MKILSFLRRPTEFQLQLEQLRPRLYRLAYSWCHNASLAEDLVQEALIKALKNEQQLRDPSLLNSWLFSILNNCWRDHFRQKKEMDDIDDIEDFQYAHEITPEHLHAQSQIVHQVRQAVEQLPLGQRQVLTLVDLEELSYIEVAAILNIPVGTVMSRLSRARAAMKSLLQHAARPQLNEQTAKLRRIK